MTGHYTYAYICIAILLAWIISAAAWVTHVVMCITAGAWGFLIAGALVAPIGVIHGIGIWFGAW